MSGFSWMSVKRRTHQKKKVKQTFLSVLEWHYQKSFKSSRYTFLLFPRLFGYDTSPNVFIVQFIPPCCVVPDWKERSKIKPAYSRHHYFSLLTLEESSKDSRPSSHVYRFMISEEAKIIKVRERWRNKPIQRQSVSDYAAKLQMSLKAKQRWMKNNFHESVILLA